MSDSQQPKTLKAAEVSLIIARGNVALSFTLVSNTAMPDTELIEQSIHVLQHFLSEYRDQDAPPPKNPKKEIIQ